MYEKARLIGMTRAVDLPQHHPVGATSLARVCEPRFSGRGYRSEFGREKSNAMLFLVARRSEEEKGQTTEPSEYPVSPGSLGREAAGVSL
jgi:hypothetical protein